MWKVMFKQKTDTEWDVEYFGTQNEAVLFFESMAHDSEMDCKKPEFEMVD